MKTVTVEMLEEMRNELLKSIKKGDVLYRSAYVDGVLDMFNLTKAKIEPEKIKVVV